MKMASAKPNVVIPAKYSLSGGHVKFFYDKGRYIYFRFCSLYGECKTRGVQVNSHLFMTRAHNILHAFPARWYNDWLPSDEEYDIVIARIKERIDEKPNLYPDKDRFLLAKDYKWIRHDEVQHSLAACQNTGT